MGKQWNQWQTIFLGSKITADGDCSHEIKRCLFLGGKAMTYLDSILKSRDITLLTKICIVKAMVFHKKTLPIKDSLKKNYDQPRQHIKKQRQRPLLLLTKVCLVKAMVFPTVMYGYERWTIKKADQRIDAFELWCWRRLESPLDSKEIQPVYPKGNQS